VRDGKERKGKSEYNKEKWQVRVKRRKKR